MRDKVTSVRRSFVDTEQHSKCPKAACSYDPKSGGDADVKEDFAGGCPAWTQNGSQRSAAASYTKQDNGENDPLGCYDQQIETSWVRTGFRRMRIEMSFTLYAKAARRRRIVTVCVALEMAD